MWERPYSIKESVRFTSYLTLPAIHRLLFKLLTNDETDLRGADCGRRVDVEMVAILLYHHVRFGSSCHCHLPQHGVNAWKHGQSYVWSHSLEIKSDSWGNIVITGYNSNGLYRSPDKYKGKASIFLRLTLSWVTSHLSVCCCWRQKGGKKKNQWPWFRHRTWLIY